MIVQDKFLSFSGRITDISTPIFKCTVSTNKESLFRGLSTIVFEVHPVNDVRACAKIFYPSVFTKSERHQYHKMLCEMLNEAGENGSSLGNVVAEARTLFVSRGICETFVNLTTTDDDETIEDTKQKKSDTEQSYEIPQIIREAERGDSDAQMNLGRMYCKGSDIEQDSNEAIKWLTKAAEQGNLEASFGLGMMYYYGKGIPFDYKKAAKWLTKAAEQGHEDAQNNLSVMYSQGLGVSKDDTIASAWQLKAKGNYSNTHQEVRMRKDIQAFGECVNRPVPVSFTTFNLYLHLLRTSNNQPLFFHRIGSVKLSGSNIDVIELVSVDASEWHLLYFDMYHKDMSTKTPANLHLCPSDQLDAKQKACYPEMPWFGTSHKYLPDFPKDIPKVIDNYFNDTDRPSALENIKRPIIEKLKKHEWGRPEGHLKELKEINLASQVGLNGGSIYTL